MSTAASARLWIRDLARPYLRTFRPVRQTGALCGWWFLCTPAGTGRAPAPGTAAENLPPQAAGFFVGYLLDADACPPLDWQPPEAVVFAFVHPVGGALHGRLVAAADSLFRKSFHYIRWLTHRPPRFELHEQALAALVRHDSLRNWPEPRRLHYSRNFFIETLAWLVRSGLVRRLREECAGHARPLVPNLEGLPSRSSGRGRRMPKS
ncbi:MAG: hypothetical protein K6U02_03340 [Firmicutes bacterium]|nr:hypothetical protein [Bacillota bacterium]